MATTRATFGNVLNVVTSTATACVSLVDDLNQGLNMLSSYIKDAAHEQAVRSKLDNSSLDERLLFEATQQSVKLHIEQQVFCSQSENHATLYAQQQARFLAVLEGKA